MAAIKCIGILTSGGDAPGMNAAIRAVTRTAIYNGFTVKGILRGYRGLVTNEIVDFHSSSVSNIIQLGGTILKTARCEEFKSVEGRQQAYENPRTGGAMGLAERVKKEFPQYDARVTILGHIQRGGSPSAQDRILASRMGAMAIQAIMEGQRNVMIGIQNNELVYVPFSRAVRHNKSINRDYVNLVKILSM